MDGAWRSYNSPSACSSPATTAATNSASERSVAPLDIGLRSGAAVGFPTAGQTIQGPGREVHLQADHSLRADEGRMVAPGGEFQTLPGPEDLRPPGVRQLEGDRAGQGYQDLVVIVGVEAIPIAGAVGPLAGRGPGGHVTRQPRGDELVEQLRTGHGAAIPPGGPCGSEGAGIATSGDGDRRSAGSVRSGAAACQAASSSVASS